MNASDLVQALEDRAADTPSRVLYRFLPSGDAADGILEWSYQDTVRKVRAFAAMLAERVRPGSRALLLFPAGLDFVRAFYGCLHAGIIAVPAYPPEGNPERAIERLSAIVQDSGSTVVLTTQDIAQRAQRSQSLRASKLTWLTAEDCSNEDSAWRRPAIGGETIAFLQYTSGSTGSPKGVMVTHGNLIANAEMLKIGFAHASETRIFSWLPLYHDMGLIGQVIQALWIGGECTLMAPHSFLERPLRWLEGITRFGCTTSGAPNFAYDLCVRRAVPEEVARLNLSTWRVAFNGAEPVRAHTLDKFMDTFEPCGFRRDALLPCYGLAEATLFVSGKTPGQAPRVDRLDDGSTLVSCGKPAQGCDVAIVDPASGQRLAEGETGEIWLRGALVAQGYWQKAVESEAVFGARLADGGSPWLRTGDLGFLRDRELFINGRLKDLIILSGRNIYPQDLELTIERCHRAVRPGCVAVFAITADAGDSIGVVAEINPRASDTLEQIVEAIRQSLHEQHEVGVSSIGLLPARTIPKTSSGKIQRSAARAALVARSVPFVHMWSAIGSGAGTSGSDDRLERELVAWVSTRLHLDSQRISIDTAPRDYGLDSVAIAELAADLESWLGCQIDKSRLATAESLRAVVSDLRALGRGLPETALGVATGSLKLRRHGPIMNEDARRESADELLRILGEGDETS